MSIFLKHAGAGVIVGVAATASIVKIVRPASMFSSLKNSPVIRHFKKFYGDPKSGQINTNVQRDFWVEQDERPLTEKLQRERSREAQFDAQKMDSKTQIWPKSVRFCSFKASKSMSEMACSKPW